jgi:hypothetical protein
VGLLGLFFAWLTYIWLRPSMSAREVEKVQPKVGSIISQKNVSGRIFGQVLDAHTGEAIFNAQLELKRREATEAKTIETATTNREGRFQFNTKFKGSDHMTLTASTSTHMTIHALVHSAEVTVHLILRRRETLRQLIEWARTRGTPWHRSPASTPFQVRTAADGLKRSVEKGWSEDVARAAYGAKTPKEQEVRALRTPETWEESHHQRDHPGDD